MERNKFDQWAKAKMTPAQKAPEDAWQNIQNRLEQKKNQKIAFWFTVPAGIAALFLIGFFIYRPTDRTLKTSNQNIALSGSSTSKRANPSFLGKSQASDSERSNNMSNNLKYSTQNQTVEKTNSKQIIPTHYHQNTFDHQSLANHSRHEILNSVQAEQFYFQNPSPALSIPEDVYQNFKLLNPESSNIATIDQKKKDKKELKINKPDQRFSIAGFVAPTYIQAFDRRSMLSESFQKGAMSSYSAGASIKYALSNRVKLRTGIGMLSMEQHTANVPISYATTASSQFTTFHSLDNMTKLPIHYTSSASIQKPLAVNSAIQEAVGASTANLDQKVQFIEIPTEAEITVFNYKRWNFSTVLGGSSYLLNQNSLDIANGQNPKQKLGEATNLNTFSFSANAGFKVGYEVSKDLRLEVEPDLKYMLRPINDLQKSKPIMTAISLGVSISF